MWAIGIMSRLAKALLLAFLVEFDFLKSVFATSDYTTLTVPYVCFKITVL